jgi:hypothetical protein
MADRSNTISRELSTSGYALLSLDRISAPVLQAACGAEGVYLTLSKKWMLQRKWICGFQPPHAVDLSDLGAHAIPLQECALVAGHRYGIYSPNLPSANRQEQRVARLESRFSGAHRAVQFSLTNLIPRSNDQPT